MKGDQDGHLFHVVFPLVVSAILFICCAPPNQVPMHHDEDQEQEDEVEGEDDVDELKDVGTSGRVDLSAKRRKIMLMQITSNLKEKLSKDAVCDTFSNLPPLKKTHRQI